MRLRARLVGLGATLALLALVVGLPTLLFTSGGSPIPAHLPTFNQIQAALTSPDDGSLALGAIRLVAWLAWAVLTWAVLLEIVAHLRGAQAPRMPGFHLPQLAARQLVAAAALLFAVVPAGASIAAGAQPAYAAEHTPTSIQAPADAPAPTAPTTTTAPAAAGGPRTYTVRHGDSLSKIAAHELGDANLWPQIAALNPAVAQDPSLIYAGTQLQLPTSTTAPAATGGPRTYTVRPGDSLSKIAAHELGDANLWPQIFQASKDTIQPDGRRIVDPGQIDVGQVLTIPAAAPDAQTTTATAARSTTASSTTASPANPLAAQPADPPTTQPAPPASAGPTSAAAGRPGPVEAASGARPADPAAASEVTEADATGATPAPSAVPSGATLGRVGGQDEHTLVSAWMLTGLTGAGAVLAGSLWVGLARRRRAQFRSRQPGRTLAAPAPILGPVEKTITAVGAGTAPTIDLLDRVLRRLAATAGRDRAGMPDLAAVQLTTSGLVLHLGAPAALPAPWTGSPDAYRWQLPATVDLDDVGPAVPDQPAPYPLLATIGEGDDGEVWLFNFEDLDVTINGDPTWAGDFARYVAAELATSPWASTAAIDLVGLGAELAGLDSDRLHVHQGVDLDDPIAQAVADAVSTIDRTGDVGADVVTARAWQAGIDSWAARLLLVEGTEVNPALDQLLELVGTHQGRTATCVVVNGTGPGAAGGVVFELSAHGRVRLPDSGLDLVAVGLTADEAQGIASLMAAAESCEQVPVPVDAQATEGWRAHVDAAGALRPELTSPRGTGPGADPVQEQQDQGARLPEEGSTTLLDQSDATYLASAATTVEDLQLLAPMVSAHVRRDVEDADPTLDKDLAMWQSDGCPLPRLRLLGPVRATTRGKALVKRKAYFTELLTFMALHPNGATAAEVAEAFDITPAKVREYVRIVREWLGTNPRTGQPHLPDARLAPGAARRGEPVYQVIDVLVDLDLFRRLRARGQARGAADGMSDLRAALALVDGRPFDTPTQRRAGGGWTWLIDGDRHDEHAVVAVVDVAHLVCTHDVTTGQLATARLAAETASLAAPYDEMARLDLAAVASAEGRHAEATAILRDDIANRSDDDGAPTELPARTEQILAQRPDWLATKAS